MKKDQIKKIIVALIIVLVFSSYFIFDLNSYFNLDNLKESKSAINNYYQENTLKLISMFFIAYVIIAAFSLPGAAVMTLASGAIFGFFVGLAISSLASTLGALIAAIVSRYLLRDWVENKFSKSLEKINKGIKEEGGFYLFTLRLIPIFPFFIINLVMGLTKMPMKLFFMISWIGMLPGTAIYVFAGMELSEISRVSDIFSIEIIIAFALIGLFPIVAKKLIKYFEKKKFNKTNI